MPGLTICCVNKQHIYLYRYIYVVFIGVLGHQPTRHIVLTMQNVPAIAKLAITKKIMLECNFTYANIDKMKPPMRLYNVFFRGMRLGASRSFEIDCVPLGIDYFWEHV